MVAFVWLPRNGVSWTVVLPLKNLTRAKTRLDRPDRSRLALAMALDTVTAVLEPETSLVGAVMIVTNDQTADHALSALPNLHYIGADQPDLSPAARGARLVVIPDEPDRGLNPALVHGAALASARWPTRAVAALSADLPALRPPELHQALSEASQHRRAVLADAAGTGTVLLTASAGAILQPAFGPHSHATHRRSGAVDLTGTLGGSVPGLRRDVDTLADLAQARDLGVGWATRAALTAGYHSPLAAEDSGGPGGEPGTSAEPGLSVPPGIVGGTQRRIVSDASGPGRAKKYP
ncbi:MULTISPECIES: 2-phospho-L-lactate guanylyltransferase [unclassified Frankia]